MNSKHTPPDRPALPRIRELKAEGRSLRQIAEQLQQEGVPPPRRGGHWHHKAVDRLLARANTRPAEAPLSPAPPPPPPLDPPPAPAPPDPARPARLDVKIHGPWIDTDSRLWEFLLHKVWEELPTKTDHTLPLDEALEGLRLTSRRRDRAHLAEALARLAASHVKLELQLNDHRLSVNTPLLSSALAADSLSFQFPTALIKLVKNPQQYIRLTELLGASR